jgi:hypothetical protein
MFNLENVDRQLKIVSRIFFIEVLILFSLVAILIYLGFNNSFNLIFLLPISYLIQNISTLYFLRKDYKEILKLYNTK